MAKIYRLTDRIEVKLHDLKIKLSPLTLDQKTEIHSLVQEGAQKSDTTLILKATRIALKYCIKEIQGLQDMDDGDYELEFDDNGHLSDDNVEDLLNMSYSQELATICSTMAGGIPENNFVGSDGKPLKGVSIIKKAKRKGKKSPN